MNNETLNFIQKQLNYKFSTPQRLKQAFTRKSYAEEQNDASHNEVLEFYGDKALEFIVMKKLSKCFGEATQDGKYASQKTEGQLTDIKKNLVCKKMLAHRIDMLNFADYLLMSIGDELQNVRNQESVKEDLFEAIVGAVAIDCGWNAEILEEVVDRMIDIEYYLENGFRDDENYVGLIQSWCQKKYGCLPEYNIYELNEGYECILSLSSELKGFSGQGYSKREARMNAAREAYEYLDEENELILPIEEVGEPNIESAINQLQELYQKGYIEEPRYEFDETHDDNGNPVWLCRCLVENMVRHGNYSSKKNGKKAVAYAMLCEILNREADDET